MERLRPVDLRHRESTLTEITRTLLGYLLYGDLKPGDRLPPERQLAEALGVGRSAVREALKALTLLGLIEIRPGNGSFLNPDGSALLPESIEWGLLLGERRLDDFLEARLHLEIVLAGLAARRRTDEDVAAMRQALDRMLDAGRAEDPKTRAYVMEDADGTLHAAIWGAAHNAALGQAMASIRSVLEVWIRRVLGIERHQHGLYDQHREVVDAIERGDEEAARRAMAEHMEGAVSRIHAIIERDRAAGGIAADGEAAAGSA